MRGAPIGTEYLIMTTVPRGVGRFAFVCGMTPSLQETIQLLRYDYPLRLTMTGPRKVSRSRITRLNHGSRMGLYITRVWHSQQYLPTLLRKGTYRAL